MPDYKIKDQDIVVSIIVCSNNRKEDLLRCFDSIKILKYPYLEIIWIDNGSIDGSFEAVKKKFPYVKIIKNSKNLGTDYSRNQGIKIAKGKYVWFLDSDTIILSKDCLKNMLVFFKKNKKTGSLGGQIIKENGESKYWIMGENKDMKISINTKKILQYSVHYLATCNCIIKKELLEKIGGFDINYFYYCEDLDLGLKIKNLGFYNIFRSDCCVLHNFSQKQRIGDYYLFYRNMMRCLIINRTKFYLFFYPFTQLYRIYYDFKKFRKEKKDINSIKTVKYSEKNRYKGKIGTIKLGIKIISSLAKAYVWNIVHLQETIYIKNKKPNFLELVK